MRLRLAALTAWVATACVSGPKGCAFAPLPAGPAPYDVAPSQLVEGGAQAHLSAQGLQKIIAASGTGASFEGCIAQGTVSSVVNYCDHPDCAGGATGCPIFVYLKSADRSASATPAPPFPPAASGDDDGKDGVTIAMDAGTPAQAVVTVHFDLLVPSHISAGAPFNVDCYLYTSSAHLTDDTQSPLVATENVDFGLDTADLLTLTAGGVNASQPTTSTQGCGSLGAVANSIASAEQGYVITALTQQISTFVQNSINQLVPNPPGLAAALQLPNLAPYARGAVDDELYDVAGAFSAGHGADGGLDFGLVAGVSSDADPTTRGATTSAQPAACAAGATVPDLAAAPWSLAVDPVRGTFVLLPSAAFFAAAEPQVGGAPADFAFGLSTPQLWLGAQHLINSGALCSDVGGANLPALTTGELWVLADASGTFFDDVHQPLLFSLSPVNATATVNLSDAGTDRLDLSLTGLRLSAHRPDAGEGFGSTFDAALRLQLAPAAVDAQHLGLEPLLLDLKLANVVNRVDGAEFDAGSTTVDALAPALDRVALRQLAGAFGQLIPLPGNARLVTRQLVLARAQDANAGWLIVAGQLGAPPDGGVAIDATVTAVALSVPPEAQLRALFDGSDAGARPHVAFTAGPQGSEVTVRVDRGAWPPWRAAGPIDLNDEAFLIQGPHLIEVRARTPGAPLTEGAAASLPVVLDSVPPLLSLTMKPPDGGYLPGDPGNAGASIVAVAHDFVSDDPHLAYAFGADGGGSLAFSADASVSVEVALSLTDGGALPLDAYATDDAGNVAAIEVALPTFHASAGGGAGGSTGGGGGAGGSTGGGGASATGGGLASGGGTGHAKSGCGCSSGDASSAVLLALGLWAARRRLRCSAARGRC